LLLWNWCKRGVYGWFAWADNEGVKRRALSVLLTIAACCVLMTGRAGLGWGYSSQAAKSPSGRQSAPAPNARIDINTARLEELMKAPGMTHTWATRIIRFRPYRAKNELLDKGIVSNQVYEHIKDYVIAHRSQ